MYPTLPIVSALAKAAAIFTGGVFIGGFKKVNEQTTQLSRNLNISRDQALKLRNSFESSRFSIAQLLEGQGPTTTGPAPSIQQALGLG